MLLCLWPQHDLELKSVVSGALMVLATTIRLVIFNWVCRCQAPAWMGSLVPLDVGGPLVAAAGSEQANSSGALVPVVDDPFNHFQMPYPVATVLEGLNQRAYVRDDGVPEWLWSRAHSYCEVKQDLTKMLRVNREALEMDLRDAQVDPAELHFRGAAAREADALWTDHTMESRCFLVALMGLCKNRSLKYESKVKALNLLNSMVHKAFEASRPSQITGMVIDKQGISQSHPLSFNSHGVCGGWLELLGQAPGAVSLWKQLKGKCWLDKCITSGMDTPTLHDIWLFLTYLFAHPAQKLGGQPLWAAIGKMLLPRVLLEVARWLDAWACKLSQVSLQALPQLRTKFGKAKKHLDPVNKLILLQKLKAEKIHRKRVAATHQELVPVNSQMIQFESYLDTLLYAQALQSQLPLARSSKQISVHWDPSTYGGKQTMVAVAYSPLDDCACYLLSQQVCKVMLSEVDDQFVNLSKSKKLCRVEGYSELRSLSHSLLSIGMTLDDFLKPKDLLVRPLTKQELHIKSDTGRWLIYNKETGEVAPVIPDTLNLSSLPVLCSVADQGPVNTAACNFCQYHHNGLLLHSQADAYHRAWNDVKQALKKTSCGGWRCLLELTVFMNLAYGPFNSSSWFYAKKALLESMLLTQSSQDELWRSYQHLIAQERRLPEPSDEDAQLWFDRLAMVQNFVSKGPCVKLMRWWSFFESCVFFSGDFYCTKMVMSQGAPDDDAAAEPQGEDIDTPEKDARKEIQKLKQRQGSWKLGMSAVNPKNMSIKDSLLSIGKSSWLQYSMRAKHTISPVHIQNWNIAVASQMAWADELVGMVKYSLEADIEHLLEDWAGHANALCWHVDIFEKMLCTRAMGLTSTNCLPPMTYCHCLSSDHTVALAWGISKSCWQQKLL